MEKIFRTFASNLIKVGSVKIELPSGMSFVVGDGSGDRVGIRFKDAQALSAFTFDPSLRFGELFMDGRIEMTEGTIYEMLVIGGRNFMQMERSRWIHLLNVTRKILWPFHDHNTTQQSRRNVAHHYDLDAALYALFLDSDRQYSCAYFEDDTATLEEAQLAKKRHIAAKLVIEPTHRVLDIGCGWGGMGLYLARYCGAQVNGITLSQEQYTIATRRALDEGLSSAASFHLQDYRDVDGRFDRVVSVGMLEHVGRGFYDTYFQKLARLLEDDGIALIHSIGRAGGPWPTNPWVAKYIFPGGYIPALSELMPAIERAGLYVTDIEILRLHYAETLKAWRERFMARRNEAKALYDERFCRMWEFYLAGAESSFRVEGNVVFQLQLAKRVDVVPLTRDYIGRREAELRRRDSAPIVLRIAGGG